MKLKLENEFDIAKYLDIINACLTINLLFVYFLFNNFQFIDILIILLCIFFSFFKYNTLKNIHYFFWPLSLIHLFIIFYFVFSYWGKNIYFFQSIISLVFLAYEIKIVSSPIFFPQVKWWEYDFRYRSDLKVKIDYNNESCNGRIIDVRSKSLGLISFKKFKRNTNIKINYNDKYFLTGEIISSKESNPGRGYCYGLRLKDNKDYYQLEKIWNTRNRIRKRFAKV